jgi:hypothetical protein
MGSIGFNPQNVEPDSKLESRRRLVVLTVLTVPLPITVPLLSKVTVPVGACPPVFTSDESVMGDPTLIELLLANTWEKVANDPLTTMLCSTCSAAAKSALPA